MSALDPYASILSGLSIALPYVPIFGFVGAVAMAVLFGAERVTSRQGWPSRVFLSFGLLWMGGVVVFAGAVVGLAATGMAGPLSAFLLRPEAGLATIVAALGLLMLKGRVLWLYGMIEVGGALMVIFAKSLQLDTGILARLASLVVAMYFLVRGLENMSTGASKTYRGRLHLWFALFTPQQKSESKSEAPN